MSLDASAIVWAHSEATGSELLVLLAIADHEGDGGAWPAMETLARRGRVTRDAARKIVRRLEARGEITTETNGGGGLRTASHMRTNRYEVNVKCPEWCDRTARHRDLRELPQNPPAAQLAPSRPAGGPPAAGTPEPPINNPNKQDLSRSEVMGDQEFELISPNEGKSQDEAEAEGALAKLAKDASHKPVKRPDYSKSDGQARRVPPAPKVPRFDSSMLPPRPEHVSDEQQALNLAAEDLRCDAGFGDGSSQYHWCPPTGDGCVRCGETSRKIIDQMETTQ